MKTGQDSIEFGLYVSGCCEYEMTVDKGESFRRCPRCGHLCTWDLLEPKDLVGQAHGSHRQDID
jgi:hypothetical protein